MTVTEPDIDRPDAASARFPVWLSPLEVAKLLDLNRHTVYRLLRDGELPGARIGGRWFVSQDALARRVRGEHQGPATA